jgi:hypothetical protein
MFHQQLMKPILSGTAREEHNLIILPDGILHLLNARTVLRLLQKALDRRMGIDPCTWWSWEKGKHNLSKKYLGLIPRLISRI